MKKGISDNRLYNKFFFYRKFKNKGVFKFCIDFV